MVGPWSRSRVAAFIWVSISILGCGSGAAPQPARYPVTGKVLFKGKPAKYAVVSLIPVESSEGIGPAEGRADIDGNFEVKSYRTFPGAEPGDYLVSVSWQIPGNPLSADDPEYGPELLPKRYQDPATSGLKATVEATENELPTFELNP